MVIGVVTYQYQKSDTKCLFLVNDFTYISKDILHLQMFLLSKYMPNVISLITDITLLTTFALRQLPDMILYLSLVALYITKFELPSHYTHIQVPKHQDVQED